jgi:LPXTG-site transpeptidase (sortase) family protein
LIGIVAGAVFYARDRASRPQVIVEAIPLTSTATAQAQETASSPTLVPSLTPVPEVILAIPDANVSAPIIPIYLGEGGSWNVSQLGFSAGHLTGTAWLDQPGNIVLAGHVEMANGSPGIFAHLNDLETGDVLLLFLPDGVTRMYNVSAVRTVDPDDLSVLYPTAGDELTLITCDDYDFTTNTYLERLVVTSTRVT